MRKTILTVLALAAASVCAAGTWDPFDESAFEAARKQGKLILLQFTADGCFLCNDQEGVLVRVLQRPELKNVSGFRVDEEASKDIVRRLRINGLSTLVLLKGDKELNRAAGIASESDILAFLMLASPEKIQGRHKSRPSNRTPPRP